MKRILGLCLALIFFASCGVFSDLRKREFRYTEGEVSKTLRISVPKKYVKRESVTDSAGNQRQYFRYSNGAVLYLIETADTAARFQSFDTAYNIPKPFYNGGLMVKGVDTAQRFWRELRVDSFRIGYRAVPHDQEILFDSAVNYAGMLRFKKASKR